MRIYPVQYNYKTTQQPEHPLKKHQNLNFTSLPSTLIEQAQKIPIEERLGSIINIMRNGDLLMSGKTLKTSRDTVKQVISSFDNLLKRLFFVEEKSFDGTLSLFKNNTNELEVINPNNFDIFLRGFGKTDSRAIKQGERFYAVQGDVLTISDVDILIREDSSVDLSTIRPFFSSIFDFNAKVAPEINKINTKSLASILKTTTKNEKGLTFSDVGGQDGVIKELQRGILFPIKYPQAYTNSKLNHGFVMYGPPGTGKTLIAQALANETNANFIKLNGLELESKWVGESEENWRKLFELAKENQPSIIFLDEFDAIAKKRGGADVYGDKVVNQILTLMSDIEKDGDEIFVIAVTNKLDLIDDAIIRSGRFGKHIEVKAPENPETIEQILDIHICDKPIAKNLNKTEITKKLLELKTTGADISHITNTASEKAYERCGIYEKMENGTFSTQDLANLKIKTEDFLAAIDDFSKSKITSNSRRPIGYKQQN